MAPLCVEVSRLLHCGGCGRGTARRQASSEDERLGAIWPQDEVVRTISSVVTNASASEESGERQKRRVSETNT